ncbi:MAG TPA: sensor histidine kinase [Hanamia sp.]|nr:sensor histidine kinase [Hanamia sp.]
MTKKENHNLKLTFLERVALFDLDKYYTRGIRFLCHLFMWVFFTFLLQITLFFDSGLPLDNTIAFASRSLICNMAVFYLFFYVLVPHTVLKNRVIPAILSLPFCVILWLVLNHYCLVFIGKHFKVEGAYYKRGVEANLHENFWYVVSPKNIIVGLTPIFYALSPYFFTKILFDIIRFYSKWFKSERKTIELKIEKLDLEKNFLKAQLNPHFLFNTLNNLYGLALRADPQTPEMISQLAEMMRYSLYESNADKVPLEKELSYLKNYIMLERRRYKAGTEIIFNTDDVQLYGQTIAPLLTFTFVENGFKYGLKSKKEKFLKITISVKNDTFYFSMVNDKEEKRIANDFGGIGLSNTRKRLELIYPDNHDLKIEDLGNSFYVSMIINLQ